MFADLLHMLFRKRIWSTISQYVCFNLVYFFRFVLFKVFSFFISHQKPKNITKILENQKKIKTKNLTYLVFSLLQYVIQIQIWLPWKIRIFGGGLPCDSVALLLLIAWKGTYRDKWWRGRTGLRRLHRAACVFWGVRKRNNKKQNKKQQKNN